MTLGQPLPVPVCIKCGLAGHVKPTCPELHPELLEVEVLVDEIHAA